MISIITAVSDNGVIGQNGHLPWRQKADLKRFRELTFNHSLIVGRKTYESIGKDLKNRLSIILTSDPNFVAPYGNTFVVNTWDDALKIAQRSDPNPFVIGGADIYKLALPVTDQIYLTKIKVDIDKSAGPTTLFPMDDLGICQWKLIKEEDYPADKYNQHPYSFCRFRRCSHSHC